MRRRARQRFVRPMLVREIGVAGQERLLSSTVRLSGRPGDETAALYLERAGVTVEVAAHIRVVESPDEIVAGALRAVEQIKTLLSLPDRS